MYTQINSQRKEIVIIGQIDLAGICNLSEIPISRYEVRSSPRVTNWRVRVELVPYSPVGIPCFKRTYRCEKKTWKNASRRKPLTMKAVYRAVNLKYMWKNWGLQRILVEFRNEIECALQKSIWSTVLIKTTFFKFEISSLSRGKPLAMKTVYRATNLKKGKIKLGYVLDTSGVPKCNRMCITESNWKVFKLMHSVKKILLKTTFCPFWISSLSQNSFLNVFVY